MSEEEEIKDAAAEPDEEPICGLGDEPDDDGEDDE